MQKYNEEKAAHMQNPEGKEKTEVKTEWKTMSMDY